MRKAGVIALALDSSNERGDIAIVKRISLESRSIRRNRVAVRNQRREGAHRWPDRCGQDLIGTKAGDDSVRFCGPVGTAIFEERWDRIRRQSYALSDREPFHLVQMLQGEVQGRALRLVARE